MKTRFPMLRSLATLRLPGRAGPWLVAAVCLALLPRAAPAQEPESSAPRPEEPPASATAPTELFAEAIEVRVVNVEVFVSDRSGQPILGLGREDFELKVDGKPMPISNFYAEAGGAARDVIAAPERSSDPAFRTVEEVEQAAPRRGHVVVMLDHSRLRAANRKRAFEALRGALTRLRADDLVAVVGIEGGSLVFYSDFLFDRQAVDRILDGAARVAPASGLAEAERRQIFGELARGMSGGILARTSLADEQDLLSRIRAYAAEEYARSVGSLRQIEQVILTLAGVPGRKAVLYVGEGIPTRPGEGLFVEWRNRFGQGNPNAAIGLRRIDFNTDYTRAVGRYDLTTALNQLAASANGAGVTLYAVDAEGDHGGEVRSALTEQGATSETLSVVDENFRAPLEFASRATGGRLLRSSGLLAEQLRETLGDFDTYYSLGFAPPAGWEAGSAHDIQIKVRGKGLEVRHRETVEMPRPDEREAGATVAALLYHVTSNPLEVRATPNAATPRKDGTAALPVTLEIPVRNLGLLPRGDVHAGSLTLYVSTKGEDGNPSRVQKIPFNLAIPDDKIAEAMGESAHYDLPLVLRPGDQQVAIGIRDNVGRTFSTVRVEVSGFSAPL